MFGSKDYGSVSEARMNVYDELKVLKTKGFFNDTAIVLQAWIIDRDGKSIDFSPNESLLDIYDVDLINRQGGTGIIGEYDEIINIPLPFMSSGITMPVIPLGKRIKYIFTGKGKIALRPDASQYFLAGGGYSLPRLGDGIGYTVHNEMISTLGFVKVQSGLKIKEATGKWTVEGANLWMPLDNLRLVVHDSSSKRVMVEEKLLNQESICNETLAIRVDSPYDKGLLTAYGSAFTDYSAYFDGLERSELYDAVGVDLFHDLAGSALFDCWVKRTGNGGAWTIVCNHWVDADNRWTVAFTPSDTLHIEAYNSGNNVLYIDGGSVPVDILWHRISVLRKGNRVALYVDGNKAAIGDLSAAGPTGGMFYIGSDGFNNSGYRYKGLMRDMILSTKLFYNIDIESSSILPDWQNSPHWLFLKGAYV
jgi:hypothetical protein